MRCNSDDLVVPRKAMEAAVFDNGMHIAKIRRKMRIVTAEEIAVNAA